MSKPQAVGDDVLVAVNLTPSAYQAGKGGIDRCQYSPVILNRAIPVSIAAQPFR